MIFHLGSEKFRGILRDLMASTSQTNLPCIMETLYSAQVKVNLGSQIFFSSFCSQLSSNKYETCLL